MNNNTGIKTCKTNNGRILILAVCILLILLCIAMNAFKEEKDYAQLYALNAKNAAQKLMEQGRRMDALYALCSINQVTLGDYNKETLNMLRECLNVDNNEKYYPVSIYETGEIIDFSISPDKKNILIEKEDRVIILDIESGKEVFNTPIDMYKKCQAVFNDNDNILLLEGDKLYIYNIYEKKPQMIESGLENVRLYEGTVKRNAVLCNENSFEYNVKAINGFGEEVYCVDIAEICKNEITKTMDEEFYRALYIEDISFDEDKIGFLCRCYGEYIVILLDANTGENMMIYKMFDESDGDSYAREIHVENNKIYISDKHSYDEHFCRAYTKLYVINQDDNSLLWSTSLAKDAISDYILCDDTSILVYGDGVVRHLDAENGEEMDSIGIESSGYLSDFYCWVKENDDNNWGDNGDVCFMQSGSVYVVDWTRFDIYDMTDSFYSFVPNSDLVHYQYLDGELFCWYRTEFSEYIVRYCFDTDPRESKSIIHNTDNVSYTIDGLLEKANNVLGDYKPDETILDEYELW